MGLVSRPSLHPQGCKDNNRSCWFFEIGHREKNRTDLLVSLPEFDGFLVRKPQNERSFGDPRYVNVFLVEMGGFRCGLLLRLKVQLETLDDALLYLRYVRIESSDEALLNIVTDIVSSLFQPRVLLQCFRLAVKNVLA